MHKRDPSLPLKCSEPLIKWIKNPWSVIISIQLIWTYLPVYTASTTIYGVYTVMFNYLQQYKLSDDGFNNI